MTAPTEHPIATPKGAAAVSIVLAALGVFTPFIVDLKAALGFAVLCSAIIIWLYLADISQSLSAKNFGGTLLVPLISLVAILGMATYSVAGKKPVPAAPPALSSGDVSRQLDDWLEQHAKQVAPETVRTMTPRPVVINIPPMTSGGKATETQASPSAPSQSSEAWREMMDGYRKRADLSAKESKCWSASYPVVGDLNSLINQATRHQNAWAYSRDDRELLDQYQRWRGAIQQAFNTHRRLLTDTSAFDGIKDAPIEVGLLGIRNVRGVAVWGNFDARRKALEEVSTTYERDMCAAEKEALKAYDAERAAKKASSAG